MGDLLNRVLVIGAGILTLVGYFLNWISDSYKAQVAVFGVVLAIGAIFKPQLMILPNALVEKKYCKSCQKIQEMMESIPEKNFRFTNYEKIITIDHKGYGWINSSFELLNAGENPIQRFPFEFSSASTTIDKTLEELENDNEFKIESNDVPVHSIKWEKIQDDIHRKKLMIVFDQKINPGETRKYSIRYQISGLYRCAAISATTGDSSSFTPVHYYEKIKLKIIFLPKYPYSNPRCSVTSPGGDSMDTKCDASEIHKDASGGTHVEFEAKYPWMYHNYKVEWDLPK